MLVRPETPADRDRIADIHVAAFRDHPFSRQTEHLIVDALRQEGALTVSLVAEVDGAVRGHVAFSSATIGRDSSAWYILGPVGVEPAFQGQGIGVALVEAGLDALRELAAEGCVLVGDPDYYGRFGFRHQPSITVEGVPPQYVLCLPFTPSVPSGEIHHHSAFSVGA